MKTKRNLVLGAVMEAAERRPLAERIQLYLAAAEFAGSPEDARLFIGLAESLQAAEARHAELALQFAQVPPQLPLQFNPKAKGAK